MSASVAQPFHGDSEGINRSDEGRDNPTILDLLADLNSRLVKVEARHRHLCLDGLNLAGLGGLQSLHISFEASHHSSPVVAESGAATPDAPAMTVQEGADIQSPGVGAAGACRCGNPAESSEEVSA